MSAQELDTVSTKCQRIAEPAKRDPGCAFTSLSHHIDLAWLKRAYLRTRKDGAAGIDGTTAKDYEQDLDENLGRLLEGSRLKRPFAIGSSQIGELPRPAGQAGLATERGRQTAPHRHPDLRRQSVATGGGDDLGIGV